MVEQTKMHGLVFCYKCDDPLEELGAILLSPPDNKYVKEQKVTKHHMCIHCYKKEMENVRASRKTRTS
jgi:hypothetical protein